MKRFILLSTILAAILLLVPVESLACSCLGSYPGPPLAEIIKSDLESAYVVFVGKVIGIERTSENSYPIVTKFRISKSWKNELSRETIITSLGTSCDDTFKVGRTYLVYARASNNILTTHFCYMNQEIQEAAQQIKILGRPLRPLKK